MIYKVNLSKGDPIRIDEEDLRKLEANISQKLIRVKQGIINPSFMVSITPTDDKEFVPVMERVGDVAKVTGKNPTLSNLMSTAYKQIGS